VETKSKLQARHPAATMFSVCLGNQTVDHQITGTRMLDKFTICRTCTSCVGVSQ
jgi:hypothetical protein